MKERVNPAMDGFKKLVSGRLWQQAVGQHPDVDLLTAFAENALLDSERVQLLQHLGACKDCREVLYLAAPASAAVQTVLSFPPKRHWVVFRWGTLAVSVVIVGAAVVAKYPVFRAHTQSPAAMTAPMSNYINMSEEKVPTEVEKMRDARSAAQPAATPAGKERPQAKHMTARPRARMEFDDSDQIRLSTGALAQQNKKSPREDFAIAGRNIAELPVIVADTRPSSPPAASKEEAKDKNDFANLDIVGDESRAKGNLGGRILDPSGAAITNAKVTASGPTGAKTATSDREGKFAFDALTPGQYSIKAEASGFKSSEIRQVAVLDKKTSTIGVRLEPGTAAETVEVSGAAVSTNEIAAAPAVDAMSGYVVAQKQVVEGGLQKVATNSQQRAKTAAMLQWTLSPTGEVQRSLDLGKTWQKVSVANGTVFQALFAIGAEIWVGGKAGALYRSLDSGQTWSRVLASTADRKLTSDITRIEFADQDNGSVSTANGEVWSTSDGGHNWRRK